MAGNNASNTAMRGDTFNMKDFDALPREVREAMANANHNWNCTEARKAMTGRLKGTRRKKFSTDEIVAKIAAKDALHAELWYEKLSVGYRF